MDVWADKLGVAVRERPLGVVDVAGVMVRGTEVLIFGLEDCQRLPFGVVPGAGEEGVGAMVDQRLGNASRVVVQLCRFSDG